MRRPVHGVHAVHVELVGMFPMTFRTCSRAAGLSACGPGDEALQRAEYPPHVQEQQQLAEDVALRLWDEFGSAVRVDSVLFTSPRGLWLSLRHRLGSSDAVAFLDGVGPLHLTAGYSALRAAVLQRLAPAQNAG